MPRTSRFVSCCALPVLLSFEFGATLSSAGAQTRQPASIQVSGVYTALSGDAYQGIKSGPGFEIQGRITPSAWSFGLGVQRTSHDVSDGALYGSATIIGLFFEPRYVLNTPSTAVFPYLSARVAAVREQIDVLGVEAHGFGTQLNAGGGLLIRLSSNLNLDVGATFGRIDINSQKIDRAPTNVEVSTSAPSGYDAFLRIGLAIGIGK